MTTGGKPSGRRIASLVASSYNTSMVLYAVLRWCLERRVRLSLVLQRERCHMTNTTGLPAVSNLTHAFKHRNCKSLLFHFNSTLADKVGSAKLGWTGLSCSSTLSCACCGTFWLRSKLCRTPSASRGTCCHRHLLLFRLQAPPVSACQGCRQPAAPAAGLSRRAVFYCRDASVTKCWLLTHI